MNSKVRYFLTNLQSLVGFSLDFRGHTGANAERRRRSTAPEAFNGTVGGTPAFAKGRVFEGESPAGLFAVIEEIGLIADRIRADRREAMAFR
ncbi:hypothetical protein HF289_05275 [Acidithiobacillus ferrooxidans]|uniref:hypothetical protein n=1 Tax=Acidithiobacillus ferrooxidans TaxID=920 RepID=UPI001C06F74B|nr:hypothetical protein [Acidithiobacillus ferrooxidans]MBU2856302.1 hypothetical protein [Acidithiobacillus ferrooxidans]MBU2862206.1 hypothetical protein [Acidithiobacillus ferrooxidans]